MIDWLLILAMSLSAAGLGRQFLRLFGCRGASFIERLSFSLVLGYGSLMILVMTLGLTHLLYGSILYATVLAWTLLGGREVVRGWGAVRRALSGIPVVPKFPYLWLSVLAGLSAAMLLLRATAPPFGATDPLAYQLALPRAFLREHYLSFEPSITGSLYPSYMGMLYTAGIALTGGSLAQMFHWLTGILCMLALVGFAQRYFTWQVGVWAAALFGFVPVIVLFSPLGYVDVGLCLFQFMAFWAMANWLSQPDTKGLLLAATLTGLAMGIKHQGMATLLVGTLCVAFLAVRTGGWWRGMQAVVAYAGVAVAVAAPWYIRSYLFSGNPVWPLANDFFGGLPYRNAPVIVGERGESAIEALFSTAEWLKLRWQGMSPWNWTFTPGGGQKAIGIYFVALLPGIFLCRRTRNLWALTGFCLFYYVILVRMLHMNPRYGLVLFAFLSILCGVVAERLCRSRVPGVAAVFKGAILVSAALNTLGAYSLAEPVTDVVTGRESRDAFLQAREGNYRVFKYVNRHLPLDATVLLQGIVKGYYCNRRYIWDHPYTGVVDYSQFDDEESLLARLRDLGVSHIVRMIRIPPSRTSFFPQYFRDPFHERFRKRYLRLLYNDDAYVLFEVQYPS